MLQYTCFGGWNQYTPWGVINQTCASQMPRLANLNQLDWPIVGEYSLCLPNGYSPPWPWGFDDIMLFRAYAEAQMQAYGAVGTNGATKGGFMWNFRTESPGEWSYIDGLTYGFVPNMSVPRTPSSFDCLSI